MPLRNESTYPAQIAEVAQKSDTTDLPRPYRSLWANSDGQVRVKLTGALDTDPPLVIAVNAGNPVPFSVRRVYAAGTTADVLGIVV